ncbi:hypothetical protein [uncultured Kordia sp.]|uniref:lipopolysaccharide biosynthesis protein n=1 Tax=uncultured Kordia sp. TaxID=507699 RepID=UPI0026028638|nr:hypothetical protein [uncultured Kordia sp.]
MNTIRGFSAPVFGFLIAVFGIKNFGKDSWGIVINAMLWIFFIAFSLGWGNRSHLVRKYSREPSKIAHSFYSNFFSRSLLLPVALLLFFFFPYEIAIKCILLVVLMHTYTALDSLVVYHQKFGPQFLGELIAFTIVFAGLFWVENFDLSTFLLLYCISFTTKITVVLISLQLWKESFSFQLSLSEFKDGFWFFAIGFSGWIFSKIDIYIVDFYLPKAQLSEYQLLITAFLMLQSVSGYIVLPFQKHMYRSSPDLLKNIQKKLNIAAIPLCILGGFGIWIIMELFVSLNLPLSYYILGVFIAIPSFFYSMNIMELMKNNNEQKIIYLNLIGFGINFMSIVFLIKTYGVFGVLVSVCITQWIILLLFKLKFKNKKPLA